MSINYALKKLFDTVEHKLERIPRLYITGKEKPSRETLDRISLLVGFQDWESFKEALHGKTDGQENYED